MKKLNKRYAIETLKLTSEALMLVGVAGVVAAVIDTGKDFLTCIDRGCAFFAIAVVLTLVRVFIEEDRK